MAKNTEGFSKELLDQLLAGRDPKSVLDSGGLIGDLKKALAERMLNADATQAHFGNHTLEAAPRYPAGRRAPQVLINDLDLRKAPLANACLHRILKFAAPLVVSDLEG